MDIGGVSAGWVYRSDAVSAGSGASDATAAVPAALPAPAPIESGVLLPAPGGPQLVRQPVARPPSASAPTLAGTSGSWFAAGVGVMVFPITLAMAVMAAPLLWMLGGRGRER